MNHMPLPCRIPMMAPMDLIHPIEIDGQVRGGMILPPPHPFLADRTDPDADPTHSRATPIHRRSLRFIALPYRRCATAFQSLAKASPCLPGTLSMPICTMPKLSYANALQSDAMAFLFLALPFLRWTLPSQCCPLPTLRHPQPQPTEAVPDLTFATPHAQPLPTLGQSIHRHAIACLPRAYPPLRNPVPTQIVSALCLHIPCLRRSRPLHCFPLPWRCRALCRV